MYYTIDKDNDVTVHDNAPAAQDGTILFASEKQLAKATAEWPIGRFVEVWNSFAGVAGPFGDLKPVKKFENRAKATARIWAAIQVLGAEVEKAAAAAVAPVPVTKKRAGKKAATPPAQEGPAKTPREGSQTAKVIALLKQDGGVTLDAIMAATGWQKHSVRGFISTLPKKTGLVITSTRRESDKARVYAAQ
jgi:hypothetical protein